jgi:Sporulation protein YtrH
MVMWKFDFYKAVEDMKEIGFIPSFIESYFIALGVILGGALIGGIASFLTGQPPITAVARLSSALRIWAIVAAIGGTFDAVYSFERGLFNAETKDIFKQILVILSALGGAQTGALLINWLTQENISS